MNAETTLALLRDFAANKQFRDEYVTAHAKQSIGLQISDLLEQRGIKQAELAKRAGLTQGVISRAADPSYGNLTINTCLRIAAGADVAFVPLFVTYSQLLRWLREWERFNELPTFDEEFGQDAHAR